MANKVQVSVLCVASGSNYYRIPGLDLWDTMRDAYKFTGQNPVIAHPPCAQWSRLHKFAKQNEYEKELAVFCWEKVNQNGGIFEHPAGSHFFKFIGADCKKIVSVDQHWWGFPCRKRTYLYFNGFAPAQMPLNFSSYQTTVDALHSSRRSIMPLEFCQYLLTSIQG